MLTGVAEEKNYAVLIILAPWRYLRGDQSAFPAPDAGNKNALPGGRAFLLFIVLCGLVLAS